MILHESATLELKKSLSLIEPALKSVCGFLNHRGGIISFGRTNTGTIIGVDPTDHSLRKLSQQITSRIKPEVTPDIRVIEEEGKHLIVVTVPEGISKPYYLDGIAYMRTGTENRVMPPDEIKRIILREHAVPWDDQLCQGATLDDIDAPSVRKFLERALYERRFDADPSTPVKIALEKLGVLSGGLPTHAAILFFGKDPQRFFTQSEVRCARFKGEEVSSTYLNMSVLHGRIDQLIEDANRFITQTIQKAAWVVPGNMQREEHWEYPPDALREAVINAVCHRDYNSSGNVQIRIFDSRVQVWNPGTLIEGVTVELLKVEHSSYPRNKTIARLLFLTGYIEQWGSGTLSMITACERDGVPDPQFREAGNAFVVTFLRSTVNTLLENPKILNHRQHRAIKYLQTHATITRQEYSNIFECNEKTARRDLADLEKKKVIVMEKSGATKLFQLNPIFSTYVDMGGLGSR
ncbi:ATP-binding protein [Methanocalculus sp.]|uniref:ATP-binding protein n=1 Tax=Methanocalculus sp. TaxID=2004547 RepID=UPI0026036124|nr:ATP-binding protein [Methanocalculus sp.]MDG6250117.1 ATP-binding protein [Methanocalculus sp.]